MLLFQIKHEDHNRNTYSEREHVTLALCIICVCSLWLYVVLNISGHIATTAAGNRWPVSPG